MRTAAYGILLVVLGIQSYWDLRYYAIPNKVTIACAIAGIALSVAGDRGMTDFAAGILPGVVCLIMGKITKEAIGYGDGLLLCAMGTLIGWEELLSVLLHALMIAGMYSLVLITLGRRKKKDVLAFVPFLFLGVCIQYGVGMGGNG